MDGAPVDACTYAIDGRDRIQSVGARWLDFAITNGAPRLTPSAVVGRSIYDFVAGAETQEIYRVLLARVREIDAPIVVPFRCDSPRLRRFMRLEMRPERGGAVEFRGILLRSEPRDVLSLVASGPRSDALVPMCSFCKRIRTPEGEWLEAEDGVVRMRLFYASAPPGVTHGLCDACSDQLHAAVH